MHEAALNLRLARLALGNYAVEIAYTCDMAVQLVASMHGPDT